MATLNRMYKDTVNSFPFSPQSAYRNKDQYTLLTNAENRFVFGPQHTRLLQLEVIDSRANPHPEQ